MAFTKTYIHTHSEGNKRLYVYDVTADGATGALDTDLNTVTAVWSQPKSMTSDTYSIKADEGVAGTATAGTIGITGVTSGDLIQVFCLGN